MLRAIRLLAFLGLTLLSTGCGATFKFTVKNDPNGCIPVTFQVYDSSNDNLIMNLAGVTGSAQDSLPAAVFTGGIKIHCRVVAIDSGHTYGPVFVDVEDDDTVSFTYDMKTHKFVESLASKAARATAKAEAKAAAEVGAEKQTVGQAINILVQFIQANVQNEADIMALFNEIDTNQDGSIDLHELKAANKANSLGIKGKNVKKGILMLDDQYGDGDGALQLQEIIDAYVDLVVNA